MYNFVFIDHIELAGFTFGDLTPSIRSVKVFECIDGVIGIKPASWSSITQPPMGLDKMSSYQVVIETNMASRCDDFRMVFRARLGGKRLGVIIVLSDIPLYPLVMYVLFILTTNCIFTLIMMNR